MTIRSRMFSRNTLTGKSRAQTLVEFALILPVLLVSLFVIIELARVLHAWLAVENGARVAVRYAVTGEYDSTYCVDSDLDGNCDSLAEEPQARINSIHDAAWAGSASIIRYHEGDVTNVDPSFFQVTVCARQINEPGSTFDTYSCPGGVEDPGDPGERVLVAVEFNHPVILPGLSAVWPELRLTALREAIVETFRITQSSGSPPTIIAPTVPPTNTPAATATSEPPEDAPECSNVTKTSPFRDKVNRFFVTFRDTNEEAGYLTGVELIFPDHVGGADYYIDYMDFNPDQSNTDWEYDINNGNFEDSPFSQTLAVNPNFWVSQTNKSSRVSVGFAGPLPNAQLAPGDYTFRVYVTFAGYSVECSLEWTYHRAGLIATSTSSSGGGGTEEPTPETQNTPTIGPTSTSSGSTPIPPTPGD